QQYYSENKSYAQSRSELMHQPVFLLDELQGWNIIQNGHNCCTAHENRRKFLDNRVTKCFMTSYVLCLKQQLIDLKKEGYSAAFMDQLYTAHSDCGSEYQSSVELLHQKKNLISIFQPEKEKNFQQWNNERWCQLSSE
uniref:FBA domain-containing protein n=1 Tax=Sinocyclocheilus rhinocerous TaxID=307959 RepID=A0A673FWV4_9TELE